MLAFVINEGFTVTLMCVAKTCTTPAQTDCHPHAEQGSQGALGSPQSTAQHLACRPSSVHSVNARAVLGAWVLMADLYVITDLRPHHPPILASKSLLCPRPGQRLGSQTGAWRGRPHTGENSAAPSAGAGTQRGESNLRLSRGLPGGGGNGKTGRPSPSLTVILGKELSLAWGTFRKAGNPTQLQREGPADRQTSGIGIAGQVRPRHEGCGGPWSKLEAVFPIITSPSK